MVWQGTVNPPLFGANRFDPYHLHQNKMGRYFNGLEYGATNAEMGVRFSHDLPRYAGMMFNGLACQSSKLIVRVRISLPAPSSV